MMWIHLITFLWFLWPAHALPPISPHLKLAPRQALSNSTSAPTVTSAVLLQTTNTNVLDSTITNPPILLDDSATSYSAFDPSNYPPHKPAYRTFSAACEEVQVSGSSPNHYDYVDGCLRSYCDYAIESMYSSCVSANKSIYLTKTVTRWSGIHGTGSLSDVVTAQSYWTSVYTYPASPIKPSFQHLHVATNAHFWLGLYSCFSVHRLPLF